jgi:predicted transcriptional regulator
MIEKIISNLEITGGIVLAAQSLVNEQVRLNANSLGAKEKTVRNHLKHKTEIFISKVQESPLFSKQEKERFTGLTSVKTYELARGIILRLTQREIKTPRT